MANYPTGSPDSINASGSRLLSLESPLLATDASLSRTGPGGDDLSLSELSLSEQPAVMRRPFSLLARLDSDSNVTPTRNNKTEGHHTPSPDEHADEDDLVNHAEEDDARQEAAGLKQEKLQNDIFVLKKLNASFELFNETLQVTESANERIAAQLEQTDALLNKYINILSKSEGFSRLIFDEKWQGAEADEADYAQERLEARERARHEAEEQANRAQQEVLRLEKERQEELQRQEKERIEREKSERPVRGGIRGVRGTRASMRGTRGTASARTDSATGPSRGPPKNATGRPSNIGSIKGSSRPI